MPRWVQSNECRWTALSYDDCRAEIDTAIEESELGDPDPFSYDTNEIFDKTYTLIGEVGYVPSVTVQEFWEIVKKNKEDY